VVHARPRRDGLRVRPDALPVAVRPADRVASLEPGGCLGVDVPG
jgi:hypothetical protein